MKRNLSAAFFLLLCAGFAFAQSGEQAPIVERDFAFKDWTYRNIATDRDIRLRTQLAGKKLILVAYFSSWCPNWKNNAPFVQKMYERYKADGLDVIAVAEYADEGAVKKHVAEYKLTFPVVIESEKLSDRLTTTHYQLRQAAGDTRKWGSPWYVLLDTGKILPDGPSLTQKTAVVNGELIEAEAEKYIRTKLGLERTSAVEVCDEAKPKTANLIKP